MGRFRRGLTGVWRSRIRRLEDARWSRKLKGKLCDAAYAEAAAAWKANPGFTLDDLYDHLALRHECAAATSAVLRVMCGELSDELDRE